MNPEIKLISAVCETKDIGAVLSENTGILFSAYEDVWADLKDYYDQHKEVPSYEFLQERHGLDSFEAKGNVKFYVQELKTATTKKEVSNLIFNGVKAIEQNVAVDEIMGRMQSKISDIQTRHGTSLDVDVTKFDQSIEIYRDRAKQALDGNIGIRTGFDAIDASYPPGLAPGHFIVIIGWPGRGKQESVDTIIPTPDGYKRFGDLKVGDNIWSSAGVPTEVTGVFPQQSRTAWNVEFTDETSVVVGPDHLWNVIVGGTSKTLTTKEILNQKLLKKSNREQYAILPLTKPVEYEYVDLIYPPYNVGFGATQDNSRDLGFYLTVHREARLTLLRGLMDSAGNVNEAAELPTNNRRFADQVSEIIRSLGGIATVSNENVVNFWTPDNPFLMRRDEYNSISAWDKTFKSITPVEDRDMQCISVAAEDQLYLTKDYTVTHNTWFATKLMANIWRSGKRPMIVSLEMTPNQMRDRLYTVLGEGKFRNDELVNGRLDVDSFEIWASKEFKDVPPLTVVASQGHAAITPSVIQGKIDQHKPDVLLVDYHQLLDDNNGSKGDTERNTNNSRELKKMALRNNIPIIDITAATAEQVADKQKAPLLSHVAWSKAIEYEADLAISTHRPPEEGALMEVASRKNRHGPDFEFYLDWDINTGVVTPVFPNIDD